MGRREKREALLRMEREMDTAEKELAELRKKIAVASDTLTKDKEGTFNGTA